MIRSHSTFPGGALISQRERHRDLTDWYSQYGNWIFKQWTDSSPYQNGSIPVQSHDWNRRDPDFDPGHYLPQGRQVTVDENHNIRDRRALSRASDLKDIGGPFFSQKRVCYSPGGLRNYSCDLKGNLDRSGTWRRIIYQGPIWSTTPGLDSGFPAYSNTNLDPLGTIAVARCKPTNNVANLATSLAEIYRDGIPKLLGASTWESRTKAAKAAGDEYLNYEFGWVPLAGDVSDASYALANAHKILSSYERNSGKQVRRRYEFPVEKTETNETIVGYDGVLALSYDAPGVLYDGSKPVPSLNKRTTFYRRRWYSGAFTYHLPVGYNSRNWLVRAAAQAGPLLGIELTPNVVWDATPWTWAIDWFSNVGSVVDNVSDWSTDGLVMRYGYMMEHTLQRVTYTHEGPTRFKPYGTIFSSPVCFEVETKRRVKATPFGFGVDWNTFSPRQSAIAIALGLSRT